MEKLTKLITKADMVGLEIKPTLKGNNRIKSVFGGILSIAVSICIIFGFSYFGMQMIRKDKPIMNAVQEMRTKAEIPVKLNPPMMIIADQYGAPLHTNPEFLRSIEMTSLFYILTPDPVAGFKLKRYDGGLKLCDQSEVDAKVWDQLMAIGSGVNVMLCLDSDSLVDQEGNKIDKDIVLRNRFGEMDSMYLWFQIKYCDEKKDPGCRDIFKSLGSSINLGIYRLNYYVDQTDYNDPVKPDIQTFGFKISETVAQAVYMTSQINEIVTDSSLFLSDTASQTYYTAKDSSTSVSDYNEGERLLFQVVFSNDKIVNINQRRYLKIPEMLANMGGFMKAAFVIANGLSYLYAEYIYYNAIHSLEAKYTSKTVVGLNSTNLNKENSAVKPLSVTPQQKKKDFYHKPSFLEYVGSLFKKKSKGVDKKARFRYLELDYLISSLLFVEDLKETKENNFIKPT